MAALSSIPVWLQASKVKVQKSDQWLAFSKSLFDLVTGQMYEYGIRSFSELSPKEQKLLVMEAVSQLKKHPEYNDLLQLMSTTMDSELSQELPKISSQKSQVQSKTDLLSQTFDIALESLLNKWPEMYSQFKQCLNEILKPTLRYIVWKSCVQNSTVKNEYLRLVATPTKLVSRLDYEISQKCQTLLNSQLFQNTIGQMKGASSIMRHLLSYYHVTLNNRENLTDVDYNLAVPFVYSTMSTKCIEIRGVRQALTAADLSIMIEQFIVFMARRPQYMTLVDYSSSSRILTLKMADILKETGPKILDAITKLFSKAFDSNSEESLWKLFQPMLRSLFVAYAPINTVMFIWDQSVITYDVEKFDVIPYICAAVLLNIRKEIVKVETWRQLNATLTKSLSVLTPDLLRGVLIDSKLHEKMKTELNKELEQDAMQFQPTHTSALANLPPWRKWYSDKLIQHYRSPKRPPVHLNDEVQRSSSAEKETFQDLETERENLIEELYLMKGELFEAQKALAKEEALKFEIQERADIEIERLRRQLDFAAHTKPFKLHSIPTSKIGLTEPQYDDSEESSIASIHTPPPSIATTEKAATPKPPPSPIKSPTPTSSKRRTPVTPIPLNDVTETDAPREESEKEAAVNLMRDLVKRTLLAANKLAHGTGQEAEDLNVGSRRDLVRMKAAYERAMVDVFGKKLTDEQLANLPQDSQQRQLLTEAIRKHLLKPN